MVSLQESMASSTNNSPYETLLDQVTALQSDLSKTFAVCQTLRAENETLAVRTYKDGDIGTYALTDVISKVAEAKEQKNEHASF